MLSSVNWFTTPLGQCNLAPPSARPGRLSIGDDPRGTSQRQWWDWPWFLHLSRGATCQGCQDWRICIQRTPHIYNLEVHSPWILHKVLLQSVPATSVFQPISHWPTQSNPATSQRCGLIVVLLTLIARPFSASWLKLGWSGACAARRVVSLLECFGHRMQYSSNVILVAPAARSYYR